MGRGDRSIRLRECAGWLYTSADRKLGGWLSLLRATWREFQDDDGFTMAAATAYYALFSFFPVALLMITVSSLFFSSTALIIAFLAWSYYTGVIFILGAEFTSEYAKARRARRGSS